jgi:hypothetical protein
MWDEVVGTVTIYVKKGSVSSLILHKNRDKQFVELYTISNLYLNLPPSDEAIAHERGI